MELHDLLRAIRRHWLLMLVTVGLSVGVTAIVTGRTEATYRASTVLFVSAEGDNATPDLVLQRMHSYVRLVKGPGTAAAVKDQLDLPFTTEQTQEKIDAWVEPDTTLLVVTATDRSPARARDLVTAAVGHLVAHAHELGANSARASPPASPPPGSAPPDDSSAPRVTITVAQPVMTSRVPANLLRNLGIAVVVGFLIGAAASTAREKFFATITNSDDLRDAIDLPTLGVITRTGDGRNDPFARGYHPDIVLAEAFRKLRTTLVGPGSGNRGVTEPFSLLLASAVSADGTTGIACGLAIALAETGSSVVLVDANLRQPRVGAYLGVEPTRGLTDVLAGSATIDEVVREWGNDRLRLLPAGTLAANPGELLAAAALAETVTALEERFDVVIVDAPPLLPVADAVILSTLTSGVLLVVRARRTRTERLARAVGLLRGVDAPLVGAVLNALPKRMRSASPWQRIRQAGAWPRPVERVVMPIRPAFKSSLGDANVVLPVGTAIGRARVVEPRAERPDFIGSMETARGLARVDDGLRIPSDHARPFPCTGGVDSPTKQSRNGKKPSPE